MTVANDSNEPRPSQRSGGWMLALRLIVSAAFLVALVLVVPLDQTVSALARMNPAWLLGAGCAVLASLLAKGVRWAWFFPSAYAVGWGKAWQLSMIGLLFNGFLPGRAGEVMRVGAGAREFGVPWTLVTITVVLERFFDAITLMVVLAVPLMLMPALTSMQAVSFMGYEVDGPAFAAVVKSLGALCLLVGLALSLAGFPATRKWLLALLRRLPFGEWLHGKADGVFRNFDQVLQRIFSPWRLVSLFGVGLLSWLLIALCNWAVAQGFDALSVDYAQAMVMTAVSIGVMAIPAAPGGWGVFEAGAFLALTAVGVAGEPGTLLAYAVVCHLCQYGVSMAFGAFSLAAYRSRP